MLSDHYNLRRVIYILGTISTEEFLICCLDFLYAGTNLCSTNYNIIMPSVCYPHLSELKCELPAHTIPATQVSPLRMEMLSTGRSKLLHVPVIEYLVVAVQQYIHAYLYCVSD